MHCTVVPCITALDRDLTVEALRAGVPGASQGAMLDFGRQVGSGDESQVCGQGGVVLRVVGSAQSRLGPTEQAGALGAGQRSHTRVCAGF
jgi:hypothetical protein